jgi:hypothetical protein
MTYDEYAETYEAMIEMYNIAFPSPTSDQKTITKMVAAADVIALFTVKHIEHSDQYDALNPTT